MATKATTVTQNVGRNAQSIAQDEDNGKPESFMTGFAMFFVPQDVLVEVRRLASKLDVPQERVISLALERLAKDLQ